VKAIQVALAILVAEAQLVILVVTVMQAHKGMQVAKVIRATLVVVVRLPQWVMAVVLVTLVV